MLVSSDDYIKNTNFVGSMVCRIFIGEGSYGKVYKIYKEEWGFKYQSALKFISIPTQEQHREALATIGNDKNSLEQYLKALLKYSQRNTYDVHLARKHKYSKLRRPPGAKKQ